VLKKEEDAAWKASRAKANEEVEEEARKAKEALKAYEEGRRRSHRGG